MHAWAEVNLSHIRDNYKLIRNKVGDKVKILAVVKAEAYGHGMVPVSKLLVENNVDYLGVARIGEAAQLRKAGISCPILLFGSLPPKQIDSAISYRITPTVYTLELARAINKTAERKNVRVKVHLKIDTGMGRVGVWHEQALELTRAIYKLANIELEGIYTHFPSADEQEKDFTHRQIADFKSLIKSLEKEGFVIPCKHAANSAGILDIESSYFNLVRPGLMLYGIYPSRHVSRELVLKPALSLKTTVVHLKNTPAGRSISYGRKYVTGTSTVIAVLPLGYGDGYSHLLSNKSSVLIKGRRSPVAGRICMDQMMVDVGKIKDVKVGDEVVLIGPQGGREIKVEEIAEACGTISYQVLCWISRGVPRLYLPGSVEESGVSGASRPA